MRPWMSWSVTFAAISGPWSRAITDSIMSTAAVPPAQVKRLRSISNSSWLRSRVGKADEEAGVVLPVDRGTVAVEQPRLGENVGAGAHRPDRRAEGREAPQSRHEAAVLDKLHVEPGADDRGIELLGLGEGVVDADLDSVGGADRAAVGGEQAPGVEVPPRHPIREPQRLDRRREGDHREMRDEQEADPARIGRRRLSRRDARDGDGRCG
jgi:hypothetical protein